VIVTTATAVSEKQTAQRAAAITIKTHSNFSFSLVRPKVFPLALIYYMKKRGRLFLPRFLFMPIYI